MTIRDIMQDSAENLDWCKPYIGQRVSLALHGGTVASLQIDGQEVERLDTSTPWAPKYSRDQIMEAAQIATSGAADPDDPDPLQALLAGDVKESPCHACPWFDVCDAMDADAET